MIRAFAFVTLCICVSTIATTASLADKGCKDIQSRCAMQIGGRCDPVSGRWEYGKSGAGGNTQAFMACLDKNKYGKK